MEPISPREEDELLEGVKEAMALVDDKGLAPDDAVAKVAAAAGHGPGKVRLLAFAYNQGKQAAQRGAATTVLGKLAPFALADPDAVLARMGKAAQAAGDAGDRAAAQGCADFRDPPRWLQAQAKAAFTKAASAALLPAPPPAYAPDPVLLFERLQKKIAGDRQRAEAARRAAGEAELALQAKFARLVDYFQAHFPADRLPYAVVAKAAEAYYGTAGRDLLEVVHHAGGLDRRFGEKAADQKESKAEADYGPAGGHADRCGRCGHYDGKGGCSKVAGAIDPNYWCRYFTARSKAAAAAALVLAKPLDLRATPFDLVRDCLALARDVRAKAAAADRLEAAATARRAALEAGARPPAPPARSAGETKAANLFSKSTVGALVGSTLARSLGEFPDTKDDLVQKAVKDLDDPDHKNELRKLETHAMLHQMMTDPENPLAGYEPGKLIKGFNELSSLAPNAVTQPAVMQPLLHRYLVGQFEPFESHEVAKLNNTLAGKGAPRDEKR